MSMFPPTCGNGWPVLPKRQAVSSSKSMSTPRASFEFRLRHEAHASTRHQFDGGHRVALEVSPNKVVNRPNLNGRRPLDDLGDDAANAGAGKAYRAGSGGGEIQNPAANERPAVIDGDDNATAGVGHAEAGAERQ